MIPKIRSAFYFPSFLSGLFAALFLWMLPSVQAEDLLRDGTLDTLGKADSPWRILGAQETGEVRAVTHADGNRTLRIQSHGKEGT